jgi:hypothetical protein
VEQRLSLFGPAFLVTSRTVLPDLGDMPSHGAPAFDLPFHRQDNDGPCNNGNTRLDLSRRSARLVLGLFADGIV